MGQEKMCGVPIASIVSDHFSIAHGIDKNLANWISLLQARIESLEASSKGIISPRTSPTKIIIEPNEDIKSKLRNEKNEYHHILIHFKRRLQRAPGSTEFDLTKEAICNIITKIFGCSKFDCEERTIHPANVNRIVICRTDI